MDTKWNSTGPDDGLEQMVAGQVQEALAGTEDAPGVVKVRVPGKTAGRLRAAAGLLALVLGVSLVLGSLGQTAGRLASGADGASFGTGWWSADWQETPAFRREISQRLRDFLVMATGGELDWWDTASGDSYVISGFDGTWYDFGFTDGATEDLGTPEEEAPDADYAADRNLLYCVWQQKERPTQGYSTYDILYTNGDSKIFSSTVIDGSIRPTVSLPEGYNFLLTFQNGTVSITKDGEPVDVYGGGFYTEDSLWDVPGYENFTAGEDVAGVTVYMAVRENPVPYIQLDGSGTSRPANDLYGLYQRIREMQTFYFLRAALTILGLVCLIAARHLRADRRRAEARLAALTRQVPGEVWWLAAVLAVLAMVFFGGYNGDSPFDLWYYGWVGSSLTDVLRMLALLPANAPALLVLVWALWLRHIIRKNTEPDQRRSLLGALKKALLAGDLKLPVQKRLRRCAAVGIFSLILIPLGASPAILTILDRVFYGGYDASWYFLLFFFLLLYVLLFFWTVFSYRHITGTARDIGLLADQVTAIRDGDLETPLDLPADADLRQTAEQLNDIQAGLHRALAEQTRSERMKVELISNVSHDLKTPLTSVLSYAELLRQEPLEGAAADYARIIDEKAHRLSAMVQDVFEVSKAASGQLPVHLERLDFAKLLRQTLADLEVPIARSGLIFKVDLPEQTVMITADGRRLYRVFQNLIDNALKYALTGSRVYLSLKTGEGRAEASLRNTSREELPDGVDLTARFVRGDASRTDGGSGLGLSIASSFTEACGGSFRVETVADLFTAVVSFPLADGE